MPINMRTGVYARTLRGITTGKEEEGQLWRGSIRTYVIN